jgi:hypothetical protein
MPAGWAAPPQSAVPYPYDRSRLSRGSAGEADTGVPAPLPLGEAMQPSTCRVLPESLRQILREHDGGALHAILIA